VVPAWWVNAGQNMPTVCSRHGRPQVRRLGFAVESSPAGWTYALLLAGLLPYFIARAASRRTIGTRPWPFCDRCLRRRRLVIAGAGAVMVVGASVFATGFGTSYPRVILGLVVVLVGYVCLYWARRPVIAGLGLSPDGGRVRIRPAHAAFRAQLAGVLSAGSARGPAGASGPGP